MNKLFDNKEYKRIYQNKDEVELAFINKIMTDKISRDDVIEFTIALMSDMIEGSEYKYFEVPTLKVENIDEKALYRFWDNTIVLSEDILFSFTKFPEPSFLFLDFVDTIGHEMTHYLQFRKILERVEKDHNASIENDEYFTQDDDLFDDFSLKTIRAALPPKVSHSIKNSTYKELEFSLNYNRYFLSRDEKQARKGGICFLDKMMTRWINADIKDCRMWKRAKKLYCQRYLKMEDDRAMKSQIKLAKKLTSEFMVLFPDLEELKATNETLSYRRMLLAGSCYALTQMTTRELLKAYKQAFNDGNDVMLPFIVQMLEDRLPKDKMDKLMDESLQLIAKDSERADTSAQAYASILLTWSGYSPSDVANCLCDDMDKYNLRLTKNYLHSCPKGDFYNEVIDNLVALVSVGIDMTIKEISDSEDELRSLHGEYTLTKEFVDTMQKIGFQIDICNTLADYIDHNNPKYAQMRAYEDVLRDYKKLFNNVLKGASSIEGEENSNC